MMGIRDLLEGYANVSGILAGAALLLEAFITGSVLLGFAGIFLILAGVASVLKRLV